MVGSDFNGNSGASSSNVSANASFCSSIHHPQSSSDSYERLSEYEIIETVVNSYPVNKVLKAKKLSTNETWYLALRHGEYSAQVDKAVSEVFRKYVSSTPTTALVKDHDDYYLASKEVNHVVPSVNTDKDNITFLHFGYNSVLTHFVGESDIHSSNILISQVDDSTYISHKIDNAESLDEQTLLNVEKNHTHDCDPDSDNDMPTDALKPANMEFQRDDILKNHWGFQTAIVTHFNYKKEQVEMIDRICKTPFEEISTLIKKYVHASPKEQAKQFMKKIAMSSLVSDNEKEQLLKDLENDSIFSNIPEIDSILKLLQSRHERYQEINLARLSSH